MQMASKASAGDELHEFDMAVANQDAVTEVPVSVVIPCYCCADTIGRAVESVMAQTILPAEMWLVEDGSEDGGRTIAVLYDL